jgi:hypothetical protein
VGVISLVIVVTRAMWPLLKIAGNDKLELPGAFLPKIIYARNPTPSCIR